MCVTGGTLQSPPKLSVAYFIVALVQWQCGLILAIVLDPL